MDLSTTIGKLKLKNPVMSASGTFGYGLEFRPYMDISSLGAIVTKGLSLEPREGNPPPRIWETPAGMLNSIGLQNIGIKSFIDEKLPELCRLGVPIIANVLGNTIDEYSEASKILSKADGVSAIEINISCPNVKKGGIHFATDPIMTGKVTETIRKEIGDFPLIIKLSPNVTSIVPFAKACRDAGADAVSLVNTFVGLAIDIETMKPRLANITGGLSGPAIKPLAQRLVWQVCSNVDIPVIGIGGIMNSVDALEYIALGASAVQVGTANFINPSVCDEIIKGIEIQLKKQGIEKLTDFIGLFIKRQNERRKDDQ